MTPSSISISGTTGSSGSLERRIGLRSAVAFNMLEMIGVGPFITLPLVIAAAGYRLSVWAWVLGAAIAVADGLVWAELGAAFPRAGGSYAFLREIYGPERAGNWLSFLYVWQVSFTAPLAIASGCIGLSSFLAWFWPGLDGAPVAAWPALHYANFAAAGACLLVTALLYRNLSSITRLAWVLFAGVLAAIAGVIVSGFAHASATGGWQMPASPALTFPVALGGLAQATLLTTYCYWGYYNICFLGSEVRRPERTIPRAILLSVLFVSAFYVAMNLAALPSMRDAATHVASGATVRLQLVADIARSAFGAVAGRLMAALIVWTAFASVFSLLLGYSRVPYAAARDGNYFRFLAAVHPRHGIPHRSLVALGLVAAGFCFFSLAQVITMLVITRILLQFFLQQAGVMLLRAQRPELARPFKMPLYPLPPLVAMGGFIFILANRSHALGGLAVAAGIGVSGTMIYLVRAQWLGQWPFARTAAGAQADSSSGLIEKSLWSFEGRIGREGFWVRIIASSLLGLIASLPIALAESTKYGEPFALLLFTTISVVQIWFMLATNVKRWHDLGLSGWMVLLTFIFIPVAVVWLGFVKGTKGHNRYGVGPA